MNITVNGKNESIEPCTIDEYLARKEIRIDSVVVEHNRRIVKRRQWSDVRLEENDTLELLRFVGGG